MVLTMIVFAVPGIAYADVIAFSGLSKTTLEDFSTYTEGSFTVTVVTGQWHSTYLVGLPMPAIYQGTDASASISVTQVGDSHFEFIGMDLSNFHFETLLGPNYELAGYLDGSLVFDSNGNVPGSGGYFFNVASPSSEMIDLLVITVSKPDPGLNGAYAIDNIRVTPSAVPEPASFLLLGTGLGAIGIAAWCRRK